MRILSFFNRIIHKRNIIIFNSYPDFSGNSLELYKYIIEQRDDIRKSYDLVWMAGQKNYENASKILGHNSNIKHRIIYKKSFKGILTYLKSKYIISTHGYFPNVKTSSKQKHINLWHGMPFKRIGQLLEEVHSNGKSDVADYTIATSEIFKDIMAKAFGISKDKVMITGQPCNDVLFKKSYALEKIGIDKKKYQKIILWMPTYRKSIVGDIRVDGNEEGFGVQSIYENIEELNDVLEMKNYLIIIKPHPMDIICTMKLPSNNRIRIIKNEVLSNKQVLLYELLADVDMLMTDYSSVFIDYLNTEKPIAFVCNDLDEYDRTRGFCFSRPSEYLPGEKITDYRQLITYLSNLDEINDKWKEERKRVNKIFNLYSDSENCKRVCEMLFENEQLN